MEEVHDISGNTIEETEKEDLMNLDEVLETIITYDATKPWDIVICQFIFYCFRNFCLQRIIKSVDISENLTETIGFDWTNLYEMCGRYCDEEFKKYLNDFFTPTHLVQVEDIELIEIFCKNFTVSLDALVEHEDTELIDKFIVFLDETLFEYFAEILKDNELYFFPKTIDDPLNEQLYRAFRDKEIESETTGVTISSIDELDDNKLGYSKKSIKYALRLKKLALNKTQKHVKITKTKTRRSNRKSDV